MRHVDHVSDPAHGIGDGQVIVVHAGEGFFRQRRTEKVIRLETPDRFPKRGQQLRSDLKAGLARHVAIRQAQQFKLEGAKFRRRFLFFEAKGAGLVASPKMMARLAIGADKNLALKLRARRRRQSSKVPAAVNS
jgi:hypothetical protein